MWARLDPMRSSRCVTPRRAPCILLSLLQLRPSGGRVFARARFAPGINSTGLAREVTMAATSTTAEILPRARAPFPASRPSDHGFFFAYVVLIWLAVLAGFVPDVIRHFQTHAAPY